MIKSIPDWYQINLIILFYYKNSKFITYKKKLISPQTKTKTNIKFKTNIKKYKLTYYTPKYKTKNTNILTTTTTPTSSNKTPN